MDKELHVKSFSQMLKEGLDEVFSSEHFKRFLSFVANNPNYSYRNALLILQQCPHATKVMGYKAWQKVGRQVITKGVRINARFGNSGGDGNEEESQTNPTPAKLEEGKKKRDFRKITVFDVSHTKSVFDEEEPAAPTARLDGPLDIEELEGEVSGYEELLADLEAISPLPIQFRSNVRGDGACGYSEITIRDDLSELHTIRTIINQMVHCWRRAYTLDKEQLEIEAEAVAFIVCQYLGLDTSEFSFHYIAAYSLGKERKALELFLDAIQKTSLYIIDSFDGTREAKRIGYESNEYYLLVNTKTASRLYYQKLPVYLLFPGEGELYAMTQKQIAEHKGPYVVEREVWFSSDRLAA